MARLVVLDGDVLVRLWDPDHPDHHATVAGISDLRTAEYRLVVPITALVDVLVGAERDGPNRVRFTLKQIRDAFGTPQPVDFPTTRVAARLRAEHQIPAPGALTIATAHTARATQIVTTCKELAGVDERVRVITQTTHRGASSWPITPRTGPVTRTPTAEIAPPGGHPARHRPPTPTSDPTGRGRKEVLPTGN
jgi:predicted nucleic acid-binding protein